MNVLVYGFGLMGKKVANAVRQHEKMNLVGVVSPIFDEDVQEGMYSSLSECHQKVDAVIDFSHPNNLDDLFQVGIIGLMKAIENFDTSLNVVLGSYPNN